MSSTTTPPLNFANVQGDILFGLPKKVQAYIFFEISENIDAFRAQLYQLVPYITTAAQVQQQRQDIADAKQAAAAAGTAPSLLTLSGINIAFSNSGLVKIGIKEDIGDSAFTAGQFADAANLGDKGTTTNGVFTPDWNPAFLENRIDGVFLVSGDSFATVELTVLQIESILGVRRSDATIRVVFRVDANVRPGNQKGHEHFGYLDNISQPHISGIGNPNPGQESVPPGQILLGRDGDTVTRPTWAFDGSLIGLRVYEQLVPELDAFKRQNALTLPGLAPEEGSELLGSRMFGRWKSGAPIDLTPFADDPALGADPKRNNDFRYAFPGDQQTQERCPFAAHTRKMNPRADLEDIAPLSTQTRRMIRRGCPFGVEVTIEEELAGKTMFDRGLVFVSYQSNLVNVFQFLQHSWANNTNFPPNKPVTPGFDPIIGQTTDSAQRTMSGINPNAQSTELTMPIEWVKTKGGEYLFAPSISALRETFALATRAYVA